jgi:hypothetical protein
MAALKLWRRSKVLLVHREQAPTMSPTITVQSSNIDLGDILPKQAEGSIKRIAGKYFGHLTPAAVHFTREGLLADALSMCR